MSNIKNTNKNRIITGKIILHNPHLFQKWSFNEKSTPRFSIIAIMQKQNEETINAVKEEIKKAEAQGRLLFGNKITENTQFLTPLLDGDSGLSGDVIYTKSYYMTCSSPYQPDVIDEQGNKLYVDSQVPDCSYGRISITFQPYYVNGKAGVSCRLGNVQVFKDRFSVADLFPSANDDFC